MTAIKTREFSGFTISDSQDFVMTLNSKSGAVDLNCQEIMAIALDKNAVFGNGQAENDIVQLTGNSYNLISQMRSSEKWILAKASFQELNPNLTDSQISKIAPKKSNGAGAKSGNSEDKIKFTATHAGNLGKAIFQALPTQHQKYLSNYDASNSAFADDTNLGKIVKSAIGYFRVGISAEIVQITYAAELLARQQAELERQAEIEKLHKKATGMLAVMGIVKPTDKESESYDADLAEYDTKLQGLLVFLSDDAE